MTGAILLDPRIYNEINCDFIHVCPQMIEILLKMKPWDKILMMTDSDSLTGMPPGTYQIGETPETLESTGKFICRTARSTAADGCFCRTCST